jgi:hypothetical protein
MKELLATPPTSRVHLPWQIAALAIGLRIAAAAVAPDQSVLAGDSVSYRVLGRELWRTGLFDNPYFMPIYPALIGALGPGWMQMLVDIAISVTMVWLVFELAQAVFHDRAIALVAALGAAIYPPLIYFSFVGLTETLFTTLVIGAYVAWYRGLFPLAAVLVVLSILTRPAVDLLAPLLAVYFAAVIHRYSTQEVLRQLALYAAIYFALMTPWWINNYQNYGAFVRLNLAGGENFHAGNNPMNVSGGGVAGVDFSSGSYAGINNPVERDRAAFNAGLEFIRQDPMAFVQRAGTKFIRFWRLWPRAEEYSEWRVVALYVASYVPVFMLTLSYLAIWGAPEFLRIAPILALGAYLTLVNVVFVASLRYRFPLEPFMIVFAAAAAIRLMRRFGTGRAALSRLSLDRS